MKRFLLFMAGFLLRDAVEATITANKKLSRSHELDDCFPNPNNAQNFQDEIEWIYVHDQHYLEIKKELPLCSNQITVHELNCEHFEKIYFYPIKYLKALQHKGIKEIHVYQCIKNNTEEIIMPDEGRKYNVDEEIAKLI